ncbi:translation initiation factor IF-2-like [Panicum virgatum]|uniref:translation initiation factor IF-2-like n=1 Tax=Panicum virgatum TaxID=38727 RepID=UPI0019D51615|nr:translation initiation factor IF-2-like [Panicum virgatum]
MVARSPNTNPDRQTEATLAAAAVLNPALVIPDAQEGGPVRGAAAGAAVHGGRRRQGRVRRQPQPAQHAQVPPHQPPVQAVDRQARAPIPNPFDRPPEVLAWRRPAARWRRPGRALAPLGPRASPAPAARWLRPGLSSGRVLAPSRPRARAAPWDAAGGALALGCALGWRRRLGAGARGRRGAGRGDGGRVVLVGQRGVTRC